MFTNQAALATGSRRPAMRFRVPARASFWVMIVAYLGLMFAASAPSPLYVVYQARWHFSAITLTSIFGVYALALLLTLLTVGGLSDFIGRKPVLLAGFALLAASMVVFARADGVGWLYLARVLQGLAAGSTLGALSAGIIDFAGPTRQRFAGLVNSLVPALGLALGALGAGGLVQFAPAPTVLVFVVLGVLFAMVLLAVAAGPETERRRDGALRSLTPRMGVPRRLRPEFFRTMPALFATWAQVGLTLSLTTTLAAARFGLTDRFLDALVVGAVCGAASVATVVMRSASSQRGTVLGCAALVTGTAITLVSLAARGPSRSTWGRRRPGSGSARRWALPCAASRRCPRTPSGASSSPASTSSATSRSAFPPSSPGSPSCTRGLSRRRSATGSASSCSPWSPP